MKKGNLGETEKEKKVDTKRVGSKVIQVDTSYNSLDRGKSWCGTKQYGIGRMLESSVECVRKDSMG